MEDGSLGKYEIRGTLGKGAMGTVYDGWDPIIQRRVAIKTVRLPDPADSDAQEELARFRIEAQAGGRLNHPNICGIFDYGETTAIAYIVMEFIDGHTLKSSLDKEERFGVAAIVRIMEELLAGLQFSHDRQVVHRDIKPANVMLTTDGQVKIADFGIARIESGHLTQAGAVLGTPAYMSPEQFMGSTVDHRTDIYSCGVMLYQLLTGERPFEGGFSAIMHKALNTQPPRPSDLSVSVPAGFDEVVACAMAKRPDERFSSASDFAFALRQAFENPDAELMDEAPDWGADETLNAEMATRIGATQGGRRAVGRGDQALLTGLRGGTLGGGAAAGGTLRGAAGAGGTVSRTARGAAASMNRTAAGRTGRTAQVVEDPPPPPKPRWPLFGGVAVVALLLAGVGGWYATRPVPTQTRQEKVETMVASPRQTEAAPAAAAAAPLPLPPSRTAIAAALGAVSCAMVGGNVVEPDDVVQLTGLAHSGGPEAAIRRAVAQAAPGARVDWQITSFDGPYCRALDVLRPLMPVFGTPTTGFSLALAGERTRLQDGDLITLHLTTPDFPANLQVDYLQHDGSVFHMHPTPTDGPRVYPAGSRQSLGDPKEGGASWAVSEPYGTEIITAVASTTPLFDANRPQSETNDAYLRDLAGAIERARQQGAKFAVGAAILVTEPKGK